MNIAFGIACFLALAYPIGIWILAGMLGYPANPVMMMPMFIYVGLSYLSSILLKVRYLIVFGLLVHFSLLFAWVWSSYADSPSTGGIITHCVLWIAFIGLWLAATLNTVRQIEDSEQCGPESPIPSGTSDAGASSASGVPDSRDL